MSGAKLGDEFVSERDARQDIINSIRRMVGPRVNPNTGKPIKPDLIWATGVIKKTIPGRVLRGEKSVEYQRAMDTLFDMRDELSQIETIIELFWHIVDDVEPPDAADEKDK